MGYVDEYRLTSECTHPRVERIAPTGIAIPGPDVIVRFTCPSCGAKGASRFMYTPGDQREPGPYWRRVATAVAPLDAEEYPEPVGGQ